MHTACLRVLLCTCLFGGLSASSNTFSLVLCTGLDNAIAQLRSRDLEEHIMGAAWLEADCVSIDPCAQTSSNSDPIFGQPLPALAGVWLSANASALLVTDAQKRTADAAAGVRAHNYGSLEFARIPEGLLLQACAPDFDFLRSTGRLQCNAATLVSVKAAATSRACPGERAFSMLDCMKPLQFDGTVYNLMRRPSSEKMHFGSKTHIEACAAPESALAEQACRDAEDFSISVPVAATLGSTSLVRYDFLEGYGCLRQPPDMQDHVLSRAVAPNRVISCPTTKNGVAQRIDAYTCGLLCDAGFQLSGSECVSVCQGMTPSCTAGSYAEDSCFDGTRTLYLCNNCSAMPGFGFDNWQKSQPHQCQYTECAAGTKSVNSRCDPCGVNTFSNTSKASSCIDCNTMQTALFQRYTGKTICETCLWNKSAELALCLPGAELAQSWQRVQELFALYALHGHFQLLEAFYTKFCTQGYACMPCEPGHYETGGTCVKCPHGFYMPNIGATECYACSANQNTSAAGSMRSSDCVCNAGHE